MIRHVFAALLSLSPSLAFAWGPKGQRSTAQIEAQRLELHAAERVAGLAGGWIKQSWPSPAFA